MKGIFMKSILHILLLICLAVCLISCEVGRNDVGSISLGQADKADREHREKWIQNFKEKEKESELKIRSDINFWGKVVDLDGNPVGNAIVTYSIRDYTKLNAGGMDQTYNLATDEKGIFSIDNKKGHLLFVKNIEKKGYEFIFSKNKDYISLSYEGGVIARDLKKTEVVTGPNSPVRYFLRKQGVLDYLVTGGFIGKFDKNNNTPYKPIYFPQWIDIYGNYNNSDRTEELNSNNDLVITCDFNADCSRFELTFRSESNEALFFLTDKKLYEAPAEGYISECTYENFLAEPDNPNADFFAQPFYLYIKDSMGKYYSIIEFKVVASTSGNNPYLRINGAAFTNPYGRRYFEYDSDYINKERQLRIDAMKARVKLERRKNDRAIMCRRKGYEEDEEFRKQTIKETPWVNVYDQIEERKKTREAEIKELDEKEEKEFKEWVESLRGGGSRR